MQMTQTRIFIKSTAITAAAAILLAGPATTVSAHAQADIGKHLVHTVGTSDLSAARKKQKRTAPTPVPQPQMWGWSGWKPADPSFDQNGRRYQPPPGLACPVDLGYGRWASCNDDF